MRLLYQFDPHLSSVKCVQFVNNFKVLFVIVHNYARRFAYIQSPMTIRNPIRFICIPYSRCHPHSATGLSTSPLFNGKKVGHHQHAHQYNSSNRTHDDSLPSACITTICRPSEKSSKQDLHFLREYGIMEKIYTESRRFH